MRGTSWQAAIASVMLAALGAVPATAETLVRGGDIGNEVWTVEGSPYIVLDGIRVATGATLVIEPGVRVEFARAFQGRIGLQVDGSLEVFGAPDAPVTMTGGAPTPGSWSGITFTSATGHLRLDYVTIDYPATGVSFGGSPAAHLSSTGLTVRHAAVAGITIVDADVRLDRFTSIDSAKAFHGLGASVTFTNCVVKGGPNARDGIELLVGGWAPTGSHALHLINCTLSGLAEDGVRAGAFDPAASVILDVRNTIVTRMGAGGVGALGQYGGTVAVTIEHSNVWGNGTDYVGSAVPGTGTISLEPGFISATDFHLADGSPCIDAGTDSVAPRKDLDATIRPADGDSTIGAVADMGAYERPGAPPACGNGVSESGEACDSGAENGKYGECATTCDGIGPHCGDRITLPGFEECDDGNADDGDGCLATCVAAACGDGALRTDVEACDDGNLTAGDGCDASCAIEADVAEPPPPEGGGCSTGGAPPIGGIPLVLWFLLSPYGRRERHGHDVHR